MEEAPAVPFKFLLYFFLCFPLLEMKWQEGAGGGYRCALSEGDAEGDRADSRWGLAFLSAFLPFSELFGSFCL